ncbi:hypothetical protein L226DRAFT_57783 [Lentinus tigrinus ALCF2SS1-7]|uniref:uncharacterized protein n=1 Tax=Lentinus tigrinus ALCF2SS1-7 TaxID=1328758 RepID=UPI001165D577|nr:hypothetical protein L226DRAFT_57783 [Lentinus tigrinus ALCF2SS1-7]
MFTLKSCKLQLFATTFFISPDPSFTLITPTGGQQNWLTVRMNSLRRMAYQFGSVLVFRRGTTGMSEGARPIARSRDGHIFRDEWNFPHTLRRIPGCIMFSSGGNFVSYSTQCSRARRLRYHSHTPLHAPVQQDLRTGTLAHARLSTWFMADTTLACARSSLDVLMLNLETPMAFAFPWILKGSR